MFVRLRTLDELVQFWREHKDQFEFACEGIGHIHDNYYLQEYEWVFGTSKSAVVQTSMRWAAAGITCEFFEWSKHAPEHYSSWFKERDGYRDSQIENGRWTNADEEAYRADCLRRTPETYLGYWQLKNLPGGCAHWDWLTNSEELINPNTPIAEVEQKLQEQTFDEWKSSDFEEIRYHDQTTIEKNIAYWLNVKEQGEDYYGRENESTAPKAL